MLSVEHGRPGPRRHGALSFGDDAPLPRRATDPVAVASVTALVVLGLLNLRALGDSTVLRHQIVVDAVGVVLLVVLLRFRAVGLRWLGWGCYALSIVLLLLVDVAGVSANGAQRWLAAGSFTMQPSELAKLGLVLVLAQVLATDRSWPWRLAVSLALAAVPVGLVVTQPDLSTSLVLCTLTLAMLVLGRIPLRVLVAGLCSVVVLAPFGEHLLRPYQLERLHAFLGGSTSSSGPGWAILQMHVAVASGGLTGFSDHRLKALLSMYLPERESDLAFASLVEQLGIVAGTVAVLAAAFLVWRVAAGGRHGRTPAASLAAAGFAALLAVEVAVSVAGNLGLVPTAGVPFPLLSSGGTAAVVHLAALGLVLGLRSDGEARPLWRTNPWRVRLPRLLRPAVVLVSVGLIGMMGFAWQLQQEQGPQLRSVGLSQMLRCIRVPAPRGLITDRHGTPLVRNVRRDEVDVMPAMVRPRQVPRLAALTARPEAAVRTVLRRHHQDLSARLAKLPPRAGRRVAAAHLQGVYVAPSVARRYPYGSLLGPILGWTGVATPTEMHRWPGLPPGAIVGRAGLEQAYDPILRGTDGRQCVYVTPAGTPVAMGPSRPPRRGNDLRLTLDLGLQRHLTQDLATALLGEPGQPRGDLGGAVMLDPTNGQVLAMASLPSYDNNVFGPPVHNRRLVQVSRRKGSPMLEHATQVVAPPGSTFKLVVAAADLRHPVVSPYQILPGGGAWTLGNHTFHNWMTLPSQDLPNAIAWSNDVYFYQLAWALGPRPIIHTARQLGVGRQSGIDLPGESPGYLGSPRSVTRAGGIWYSGSTVILGIGQGYLDVTPLQDAMWTTGVATGALPVPHFGLDYRGGHTRTHLRWPAPRRLRFARKLGPVRAGMALAATSGTASIMTALPVQAGAKTGSAEDPSAPNGAADSWFTSAAPLHRPAVVATSFVRGGGEGVATSGQVVLPAMQYFFAHERAILRH